MATSAVVDAGVTGDSTNMTVDGVLIAAVAAAGSGGTLGPNVLGAASVVAGATSAVTSASREVVTA